MFSLVTHFTFSIHCFKNPMFWTSLDIDEGAQYLFAVSHVFFLDWKLVHSATLKIDLYSNLFSIRVGLFSKVPIKAKVFDLPSLESG